MLMRFFLLITGLSLISGATAQTDYDYPQKVAPIGIDNYQFSTYYYNGKKTYNLRGAQMSSGETVSEMRINPSGSSFSIIETKGEKKQIRIYDLWKSNSLIKKIETPEMTPISIAYSPDSRLMAVSCKESTALIYSTTTYFVKQEISLPAPAQKMVFSGNNNLLVTAGRRSVQIWNLQSGAIRKNVDFSDNINDVVFADDDTKLLVLTADGVMSIYDTMTFSEIGSVDALGEALACSVNIDGKYVAILTGISRIAIVNLLEMEERQYVDIADGPSAGIRFVTDNKRNTYLVYSTTHSIAYRLMKQLKPYYGKMITVELEEKMNQWMKQMPGESLREYELRVNDKTRLEQVKLFEREISTKMASDMLSRTEISIGEYNKDRKMLALDFNTMPTIFLKVPNKELNAFVDAGKLEFRNVSYGLNVDDKFEIIYAEVYNPENKKTYVYNNLDHAPTVTLRSGANFIPMKIVQRSNIEEIKLQGIRENIIEKARKEKRISDKTDINVNADAITDYDAAGNRIINYKIGFAYTVKKGYSGREDFGSGKYHINESGAASSLLTIIKTAFETEFAQYVKPGKKLKVKIRGTADAAPISGKIAYDGKYGEYTMEPVYKNDELTNLSLIKAGGIINNDQLAFARAAGVRDYISKNIASLSKMDTVYDCYIEVSNSLGGQYRRISVDFEFVDAFAK